MNLIVVLGIECSLIHAQPVITPKHHEAFYKVSEILGVELQVLGQKKSGQV